MYLVEHGYMKDGAETITSKTVYPGTPRNGAYERICPAADVSEEYAELGITHLVERVTMGCACAHNRDGSTTALLCPLHADADPCATKSQVTGKRRKGTISRGVCSACGWKEKEVAR